MKFSLLLYLFSAISVWAQQMSTGPVTQKATCAVAGVIGNPTINCPGLDPLVVRILNEQFKARLKDRDSQIEKLTKDANDWKDRYIDLSSHLADPGMSDIQRRQAEDLLKAGKLDEASRLLSEIDKKIDNLSAKIDCNGATPEAFALAIRAHAADRVLSYWRCRPEDTQSGDVQSLLEQQFTSAQFPSAKDFLNQLVAGGYNPVKGTRSLSASDPSNEANWLLFHGCTTALMDGNLDALQWLVDHGSPDYWKGYDHLMENIAKTMRFPYTQLPAKTGAQAISMLRKAGVPADTNDYKAFRDAYGKWVETQMSDELTEEPVRLTGAAKIYAQQMNALYPSTRQPAQYAEVWSTLSAALAPQTPDVLRKEKLRVVTDFTAGDLGVADRDIQSLTNRLEHQTWWRKLPESPAMIQEARRRQALNVFDSYGYVQVAPGDLRDTDLMPSYTRAPVGYPNCDCSTVANLREQLTKASHRKELLLQFRSKYSN